MEALLAAYGSQSAHLRFIADNLPTYLPGPQSTAAAASDAAQEASITAHAQGMHARWDHSRDAAGGDENVSHNAARPTSAEAGAERRKRPPAPRR